MAPPGTARTPLAPLASASFPMSDLLFCIKHLARLFLLEVDTARELTYRVDFPEPIKIGRRWLWFPDEVLAWSRKQKRYSERERNAPAADPTPAPPSIKPYKARAPKPRAAAA